MPKLPELYEVFRLLVTYWRRWLIPAAVITALAVTYAVVTPPTWQASQALMVRNEASNNETGPGKFGRAEEMKTVQETILELAKSRGVLAAALSEVGPAADSPRDGVWPSERDIDGLRRTIKIGPPKGVEFGSTEVFYLDVRDCDRLRVVLLNRAISDQLQARFQEIRDAKAQSMIDELNKTVQLAKSDRDEATGRLSAIEKEVGSDLAELRTLQDSTSGDSALRRTITEIENELRQTRSGTHASQQLLGLLAAAQKDPGRLLAAPTRLLESQPSLKRLKDGLLDAQIRSASLAGSMSAEHPLLQDARGAENEISRHLHDELAIAIRGVEAELQLNTERTEMLENQLALATARLSKLAGLRATYVNLAADTNHRNKLVERAEQNLAEARATRASAKAASLISRIDAPDTGIRPVSAGRTMIVLAGILGGLVVGFGIVLLTAQPGRPAPASPATIPATVNSSASPLRPLRGRAPAAAVNGHLSLRQALEQVLNG